MDKCIEESEGLTKENKLVPRIGIRIVIIGWLFFASTIIAQSTPQIEIDYATFSYDDQESLVELYFAVELSFFPYVTQDSGAIAEISVHLRLEPLTEDGNPGLAGDRLVREQEEKLLFVIPDTSSIMEGQLFLSRIQFRAKPGHYKLYVDLLATEHEEIQVSREVRIPDYSGKRTCMFSDIILASNIVATYDKEDPNYKNGRSILPNTNQLYGVGSEQLFYYVEAYNTDCAALDSGEYAVHVYVTEAGSPTNIPDLKKKSKRSVRQTDILVGTFELNDLGSGTYFLRAAILNSMNEVVAEEHRKFYVYNPTVETPQPVTDALDTNSFAKMTEKEIEQELKYIQIIANQQESRRIRRVQDLDGRRRMLMNFWNVRDPAPDVAGNEFRNQFYRLLAYANERYSLQRVEGWETDRGRIILKYGRPSDIESNLYERGWKPYEIWKYNNLPGEGQSEFIFADVDGFGEFELIHSTVAGERKLPDWPQRISDRY